MRPSASNRAWRCTRRTSRRRPTTATRRSQSPILFKIHGDISRPETIVVTDEDYIQFVLRMSNKDPYDPLPLTLKFYLTGWTTLFVGYSLLDYNLRLLFKTLRWKIDSANVPDMYSVDYHPDPLIFDVWDNQRRYVKFIAQDVWAFVPRLYELVLGKELSVVAVCRRARRQLSPRLPYRGIRPFRYVDHAIFFAREDETRHLASLVAVYRGVHALRGLRCRQVVADQRRAAPRSDAAAASIPSVCGYSRGPAKSSCSNGSPPRATTPVCCRRCSRQSTTVRRGSCSRRTAFEERLRDACSSHRPLIVFDQFEEIVTLFEEAGAAGGPAAARRADRPASARAASRQAPLRLPTRTTSARSSSCSPPAPSSSTRRCCSRRPRRTRCRRSFVDPLSVTPAISPASSLLPSPSVCAPRLASGSAPAISACPRCRPSACGSGKPTSPEALLAAKGVRRDYSRTTSARRSKHSRPSCAAQRSRVLGQMLTSAGTRNVMSAEDLIQRVRRGRGHPAAPTAGGTRAARERIAARPPRAPPRPLPLRDHERVPGAVDQRSPRRVPPRPGSASLPASLARARSHCRRAGPAGRRGGPTGPQRKQTRKRRKRRRRVVGSRYLIACLPASEQVAGTTRHNNGWSRRREARSRK